MNNILITGTSAIQFTRKIVRNNRDAINTTIVLIMTVVFIIVCEIFYLRFNPQHIIKTDKVDVPNIIEDKEPIFSAEGFLSMQDEVKTVHCFYSGDYHIYEITLSHGYKQLSDSEMRDYINKLSLDIYKNIKETNMIAVINENDTEQYIYCSINGKTDYFVEPIHWEN